jgi:hypothetical protein
MTNEERTKMQDEARNAAVLYSYVENMNPSARSKYDDKPINYGHGPSGGPLY